MDIIFIESISQNPRYIVSVDVGDYYKAVVKVCDTCLDTEDYIKSGGLAEEYLQLLTEYEESRWADAVEYAIKLVKSLYPTYTVELNYIREYIESEEK